MQADEVLDPEEHAEYMGSPERLQPLEGAQDVLRSRVRAELDPISGGASRLWFRRLRRPTRELT